MTRWRCWIALAQQSERRQARPERAAGEGPAARPDGPLRRSLRRVRRGQAAGARDERQPLISTSTRTDLVARLRSFFTAGRLRMLPRAGVRTDVAAADLHPGFPALRHHAGGTDPVGASAHLRRRRAAADQRHHRHHAAHAEQPAAAIPRRWPSCGWATSARASTICATTTCRTSARWASLRAGRGLVHRQDAAERDPSRPDRACCSRRRR